MNVFLSLLLLVCSLSTCQPVYAHDSVILKCDKQAKAVTKLSEHVNPNGTLSEAYDRNGDGQVDVETISYMTSTKLSNGAVEIQHNPYPFLYVIDTDFDGNPDLVYVDTVGKGNCADIVLYKDLNIPTAENKNVPEEGQL